MVGSFSSFPPFYPRPTQQTLSHSTYNEARLHRHHPSFAPILINSHLYLSTDHPSSRRTHTPDDSYSTVTLARFYMYEKTRNFVF